MAFTNSWNTSASECDAEFDRGEAPEADEPECTPEEQMLDAIGDEVYRLVHGPLCLRTQLTVDQRVTLNFTLWAFMNDRLFWAECDEARRAALS